MPEIAHRGEKGPEVIRCPFCQDEHEVTMRFNGAPFLVCPIAPPGTLWGASASSVQRLL